MAATDLERLRKLFEDYPEMREEAERAAFSIPQRPKDEALAMAYDNGVRAALIRNYTKVKPHAR